MKGTIFQIQRWSIHDGEGIRSTVFLKGCPLRCAWCANPESWSPHPGDGYGYECTVHDLMAELRKDEVFYRTSSGGVTFSGGEPFAQADFLLACVRECARKGYDCAVETSACFQWEKAEEIVDMLDGVFMDIKHMDPARHKELTGKDNSAVLENAARILSRHPNVIIRVPLVPGCNDDTENISELCRFLAGFPLLQGLEFLPCHNLGRAKYAALSLPEPREFAVPSQERLAELQELVRSFGIAVITS